MEEFREPKRRERVLMSGWGKGVYGLDYTTYNNAYFTDTCIEDGKRVEIKIKIAERYSSCDFGDLVREINSSGLTTKEFIDERKWEIKHYVGWKYDRREGKECILDAEIYQGGMAVLYYTDRCDIYYEETIIDADGGRTRNKIRIANKCSQFDFDKLKDQIKKSGLTVREFLENRGDEIKNGLDISYELLGMSR